MKPARIKKPPPPPVGQPHFLRAWRQARGYTIAEMEKLVPMAKSSLSRVENNVRLYRQDVVERYSEILGVPIADLLTRSPLAPQDIWDAINNMSPAKQQHALRVIKVLSADTENSAAPPSPPPPRKKRK